MARRRGPAPPRLADPSRPWALLLWATVAVLAAGLASWLMTSAILEAAAVGRRAASVPQHVIAARAPAGAVQELRRAARLDRGEHATEMAVDVCAFGGRVPGLAVGGRTGDAVHVTGTGELPVPIAVHRHRLDVPTANAMDGVPALTQTATPPGGTFVHESAAATPGTRWYHAYRDGDTQREIGPHDGDRHAPAAEVDACRSQVS